MWSQQIQDDIAHRLDRGERLADIEAKLVDVEPDLSDDERAALWLFAWSYRPNARHASRQRRAGIRR